MLFDEMITEALQNLSGEFTSAELSERLVLDAQLHHPDALDEWLHTRAIPIVTAYISHRFIAQRQSTRRREGAVNFERHAEQYASGDVGIFKTNYVVNADGTRKLFADMTAADHRFVANEYDRTGKRDLLFAEFHRALAKKIGNRRTADVLTETQVSSLMEATITC